MKKDYDTCRGRNYYVFGKNGPKKLTTTEALVKEAVLSYLELHIPNSKQYAVIGIGIAAKEIFRHKSKQHERKPPIDERDGV